MIEGEVKVEDFASFEVNETNRKQICANHSVTHLVHKALRTILGEHVTQKGSLVAADRMRFDISHPKQITADELKLAEDMVNAAIRANYHVNTVLMNQDEAVKTGAMALFGEKYGEEVRVVTMEKTEKFIRASCAAERTFATPEKSAISTSFPNPRYRPAYGVLNALPAKARKNMSMRWKINCIVPATR